MTSQARTRLTLALAAQALALALALTGCGDDTPWRRDHDDGGTSPLTRVDRPTARSKRTSLDRPRAEAPVETFLASGAVPERLRATELKLRFRSNADGATFECRLGDAPRFEACPTRDGYAFDHLGHGQAYALAVRAVAGDGRTDDTPLVISFIVDMRSGSLPGDSGTSADDESKPKAGDLPPRPLVAGDPARGRVLQIGSFYEIDVPPAFLVTSYSTTKTYNSRIKLTRLLGQSAGNAYDGEPCNRSYERVVDGPDSSQYCDATPTRAELASDYAQPLPYNHIEMVLGTGPATEERILIAAFDGEADPNAGRLTLAGVCARGGSSGRSPVPGLERFFGGYGREILTWCQARAQDGEWWYAGLLTATLAGRPDGPKLTVVYSSSARLGLFGGQAFAQHVGDVLQKALAPIAVAQ